MGTCKLVFFLFCHTEKNHICSVFWSSNQLYLFVTSHQGIWTSAYRSSVCGNSECQNVVSENNGDKNIHKIFAGCALAECFAWRTPCITTKVGTKKGIHNLGNYTGYFGNLGFFADDISPISVNKTKTVLSGGAFMGRRRIFHKRFAGYRERADRTN